jgi:hypothetical protein
MPKLADRRLVVAIVLAASTSFARMRAERTCSTAGSTNGLMLHGRAGREAGWRAAAIGAVGGFGAPSPATPSPRRVAPPKDGFVKQFERGRVYWSRATGAQPVSSDFIPTYDAMGAEQGWLGFPRTRERPCRDASNQRFQLFEGGSLLRDGAGRVTAYPPHANVGAIDTCAQRPFPYAVPPEPVDTTRRLALRVHLRADIRESLLMYQTPASLVVGDWHNQVDPRRPFRPETLTMHDGPTQESGGVLFGLRPVPRGQIAAKLTSTLDRPLRTFTAFVVLQRRGVGEGYAFSLAPPYRTGISVGWRDANTLVVTNGTTSVPLPRRVNLNEKVLLVASYGEPKSTGPITQLALHVAKEKEWVASRPIMLGAGPFEVVAVGAGYVRPEGSSGYVPLDGIVHDFALYDAMLEPAEIGQIAAFLRRKHGILPP